MLRFWRKKEPDPREAALLQAIDDALLVYRDGHAGYEIDMSLMVWRPTRRLDRAMTELRMRSRYLNQRVKGDSPEARHFVIICWTEPRSERRHTLLYGPRDAAEIYAQNHRSECGAGHAIVPITEGEPK